MTKKEITAFSKRYDVNPAWVKMVVSLIRAVSKAERNRGGK